MKDPNDPKREEAPEGLDIEELAKTCGITVASGSITNIVAPLQNTIHMLQQVLSDPQNDQTGLIPFQIPSISMPQGMNWAAFLALFSAIMYADSWMRDNAIVVYFTSRNMGSTFGIARLKDRGFWESDAGKHQLKTATVQIYTVKEYFDATGSQLQK